MSEECLLQERDCPHLYRPSLSVWEVIWLCGFQRLHFDVQETDVGTHTHTKQGKKKEKKCPSSAQPALMDKTALSSYAKTKSAIATELPPLHFASWFYYFFCNRVAREVPVRRGALTHRTLHGMTVQPLALHQLRSSISSKTAYLKL